MEVWFNASAGESDGFESSLIEEGFLAIDERPFVFLADTEELSSLLTEALRARFGVLTADLLAESKASNSASFSWSWSPASQQ